MKANLYTWTEVESDHPISLLTRQKVTGERILVARVHLLPGCKVALHQHESEQIACVLSGRVRWGIGDPSSEDRQELEMIGGQVLHLPSNLPHEVTALEETWILDLLSPPGAMGVDSQENSELLLEI